MKKLLLACFAATLPVLTLLPLPANAATVFDLGLDPNLSVARNATVGTFNDEYLFTLDAAATITIVGITNTYAGGVGAGRFIANFTGTIFNDGLDGLPGTADDIPVIGPTLATSPCGGITNCQSLAGSGILAAGAYYLDLTGTGESRLANYGGSITTIAVAAPVPEPATWAMLLIGFAGLAWFGMRKRRHYGEMHATQSAMG